MYGLEEQSKKEAVKEGEKEAETKEKAKEEVGEKPAWLVEIEKYGLGSYEGRDLAAFQQFSGVDFKAGTVETRSLWGGLEKTAFVDGLLEFVMAGLQK